MNPRLCVRYKFCLARRRVAEGLPAPAQPQNPDSAITSGSTIDISKPRFSYGYSSAVVTYHTQEEARLAREKRMESVGVKPESVMRKVWIPGNLSKLVVNDT